MIVYGFNKSGYFTKELVINDGDFAPLRSTESAPPAASDNQDALWDGEQWTLVESRESKKMKRKKYLEADKLERKKNRLWLMVYPDGRKDMLNSRGKQPEFAEAEVPEELNKENPEWLDVVEGVVVINQGRKIEITTAESAKKTKSDAIKNKLLRIKENDRQKSLSPEELQGIIFDILDHLDLGDAQI